MKPLDLDLASYIDISPILSSHTAVFPGDTPLTRTVELDFKSGNNLLLSSLHLSSHLGAHTDAPNHYHPNGKGIDQVDLKIYVGSCQVITVKIEKGARIYPHHLTHIQILTKRILFKTESFPNSSQWNNDFNSLSPELVDDLTQKGVILVGIDTPSIDPYDSKALEAHQAVYRNKMAILEGIVLNQAADGIYSLVALPLKILDGDASPVRAILLKHPHHEPSK